MACGVKVARHMSWRDWAHAANLNGHHNKLQALAMF